MFYGVYHPGSPQKPAMPLKIEVTAVSLLSPAHARHCFRPMVDFPFPPFSSKFFQRPLVQTDTFCPIYFYGFINCNFKTFHSLAEIPPTPTRGFVLRFSDERPFFPALK
jgi:hypothetical protein